MQAIEDLSKFTEDILKIHNRYRAVHDSPPLQIDEKLNERARQSARSLSEKGEDARTVAVPRGENVYVAFVEDPNWRMQPVQPMRYWYQESSYYDYDAPRPKNLEEIRNFAQLVWKDTTSMGVGVIAGPDGKIYLVCSYDPAGNVDDEFRRNVSPPKEGAQLLSLEELELRYTEPRAEVVRSMERLYAVPSEKLRVWSVWLSGVSDIADEWRKWLQAHIDLIARIAECLQMAARDVPGERKIESAANADKTPDNVMPTQERTGDGNFTDGISASVEETVNDKGIANVAAYDEEEARETEGGDVATTTAWPIGRRWEPVIRVPEAAEADQAKTKDTIPYLEIPTDKEDMIKMLRNFTYKATLYRSYYKHWRQTADQALKEIAGRPVMTTAKIRGTDIDDDEDDSDDEAAEVVVAASPVQYSTIPTESVDVARPMDEGTTVPVAAASVLAVPPVEKPIDPDASEPVLNTPKQLPDDQSVAAKLAAEANGTESAELPAESTAESAPIMPSPGIVAPSPARPSPDEAAAAAARRERRAARKRLARDMARADEDIPYFFYLKAEPDMDIAIEHNDERLMPVVPGRESISVNRKCLYFNLDK